MGFYDTVEGVEQYAKMCEGYDGRALVDRFVALVPEFADQRGELLELGIGLGKDLDLLASHFRVTGSDRSQLFLRRYAEHHPNGAIELLELDAETFASLDPARRFDLMFSNKVLHHLGPGALARSLARQAEILRPGGLAFHTLWYGDKYEEHAAMSFHYYTPETLAPHIPVSLTLELAERYEELEPGDSLAIALRNTRTREE